MNVRDQALRDLNSDREYLECRSKYTHPTVDYRLRTWVQTRVPELLAELDRQQAIAEWLIAEERHKARCRAEYVQAAADVKRWSATARRELRISATLTTIQEVRDAVKGMRSSLGTTDPPQIIFFLDRLDRITDGWWLPELPVPDETKADHLRFAADILDAYLGHYNFMNSVTLRAEADRLDRISPEGEPE